jgi:hypothetical protein
LQTRINATGKLTDSAFAIVLTFSDAKIEFSMSSGVRRKPAKSREFSALSDLRRPPPISLPVRQTAGLGASGKRFFGGVTAYEPWKAAVYRHKTVGPVGRSETTIQADF